MRPVGWLGVIASLAVAGGLGVAAIAHASSSADPACATTQLEGTVSEIPYSRERATLHYTLRLTNTASECAVFGAPTGVLLSRAKKVLATHVVKPAGTEVYVVVRPGQAVRSSLLISRLPAKGEKKSACEPVAYWFRLRGPSGRGSVDVPLKPPARACRFGRLDFTYYGPG
jgi:hypothetical protein